MERSRARLASFVHHPHCWMRISIISDDRSIVPRWVTCVVRQRWMRESFHLNFHLWIFEGPPAAPSADNIRLRFSACLFIPFFNGENSLAHFQSCRVMDNVDSKWGELNRQNIMTSMAGSCWGREKTMRKFCRNQFQQQYTTPPLSARPPENFSTFITQPKPQSFFFECRRNYIMGERTHFSSRLFRPCKCRSNVHIAVVDELAAQTSSGRRSSRCRQIDNENNTKPFFSTLSKSTWRYSFPSWFTLTPRANSSIWCRRLYTIAHDTEIKFDSKHAHFELTSWFISLA